MMQFLNFSEIPDRVYKAIFSIAILLSVIQVHAQSDDTWSNPRTRSKIEAYNENGVRKETQTTAYRKQSYNFYESYSLTLSNQSRYFHVIDIYDEPITGNPLTGKYGFYEGMCVIERKSNPRNFASNSGGQSYKRVSFEKMGLSKDKAAAVYYIINKYPSLDVLSKFKLEEVQEAIRYLTREISKDSQGTNNTIAQEAYNNRFKYLGKVYFLVFYKGGYVYNQDFIKWKTADIKLGGKVFNDANDNGKKDSGENGISGVQVYLYPDYNGDGVKDTQTPIGTVTTDNNGEYEFLVNDETYIVEIEMPAGYIPGYVGNNANPTDDANDDDGVIVNGRLLSTRPFKSGIRNGGNNTPILKENKRISFGIIGGNSLMGITKTVSPSGIVKAEDELTYTITLTNEGDTRLENITLKDILPNSLNYVPGTAKRTYYKNKTTSSVKKGQSKEIIAVKKFFTLNTEVEIPFEVTENDNIPVGAQIESIVMKFGGESMHKGFGVFRVGKQSDLEMTLIAPNGSKTGIDSEADPNGDKDQFGKKNSGIWHIEKTRDNLSGDAIGTYKMIWKDIDNNKSVDFDQSIYEGTVKINWIKNATTVEREEVTESINSLDNLFVKSDGVSLQRGETITVTFKARVNERALLEIINKAVANSDNSAEVIAFATSEVAALKVNNGTIAVGDINQTPANVPVKGNVLTNDYDPEGDKQTVTAIGGDPVTEQGANGIKVSGTDLNGNPVDNAGTISINPDGTYLFTPAQGFKGTAEIEYTIKDGEVINGNGEGASSTANISIKVVGTNENGLYPPVAQDDNVVMKPEQPITIDVLANDNDIDGTINVSSVTLKDGDNNVKTKVVAGEGTWSVNAEGKVTFTPNQGFTTEPTPIVYTITDNDGLTSTAKITVVTDITTDEENLKVVFAGDDTNIGYAGETIEGTTNSHGVLLNDRDSSGKDLYVESAQAPINADGTYGKLNIGQATTVYGSTPGNPNEYVEAGTLTLNNDGSYTYVSNPDFIGSVYIPYTAENVTKESRDKATLYLTTIKGCPQLNLWVYLEGALIDKGGVGRVDGKLMRTDLNRIRLLPGQTYYEPVFVDNPYFYTPPLGSKGQVYNTAPWNYEGDEGKLFDSKGDVSKADAGYAETVVDWVLVSLRKTIEGDAVFRKAGLLHNDGHIEFVGNTCYDLDTDASYYVVVEHRNHLVVMSDKAVKFKNKTLTYDFRNKESFIDEIFGLGGVYVGQKKLTTESGDTVYAMYGGNGDQTSSKNSSTDINNDDLAPWLNDNNIPYRYKLGDYDMSGDVNKNDYILWDRNNNRTITTVIRK